MQTVLRVVSTKTEAKKSTFLCFLCPICEFKALHERLKAEHPKAAHVVWALRERNGYGQIVENQSDDGEPKGTSGQPSLNALRGAQLINAGALIVRYFGGIKLGTGGLVR
ncbi:YigZ family protein, partial [Campylobacter showae]